MEFLTPPVIAGLVLTAWLVTSDLALTYIRKRIRRRSAPSLPEREGDGEGEE
jgi:hypothetical protein